MGVSLTITNEKILFFHRAWMVSSHGAGTIMGKVGRYASTIRFNDLWFLACHKQIPRFRMGMLNCQVIGGLSLILNCKQPSHFCLLCEGEFFARSRPTFSPRQLSSPLSRIASGKKK